MSFGASASLRFESEQGGVRNPVVFWEKQANEAKKPNKKYKYKGKEQKFPLRGRAPVIEQEEPPQPKRRAPNNNNTRNVDAHQAKPKKAALQHKVKRETPATAGTVVLTQKEFDSILETIGQLAIEAEDAKIGVIKENPYQKEVGKRVPAQDVPSQDQVDTSRDIAIAKELPPETPRGPPVSHAPAPRPRQPVVEPNSVPGLDLSPQPEPSRAAPEPYRAPEPHRAAPEPHRATEPPSGPSPNQPQLSVRQSVLGIPTAHLTKAEKKRLEWERQRAESAKVDTEWSPWGRPGAGAPRKDQQGNVVSAYKPPSQDPDRSPNSKPTDQSPTSKPPPAPGHGTKPAMSTSPQRGHVTFTEAVPTTQPPPPAAIRSSKEAVATKEPPPPAAIRSSFTMGNAAPNEERFTSAKERQRLEWLQELEKQREEQRQRKLSERGAKRAEEIHDTWADRFVAAPPPTHPAEAPPPPAQPRHEAPPEHTRVYSAPITTTQEVDQQTSPNSHLRGQNIPMDPTTLRELDEKRKKQQEHQDYIKAQIEEKERLKREERDRRRREEQEEEDKLRRERDRLDGQMRAEKDKQRQKEAQERERLERLRQAMEQAQEVAEREKQEKRLRRLQDAGHDVSHLHAGYQEAPPTNNDEAKQTPRPSEPPQSRTATVEPSYIPGLAPTPRDVVTVAPSYVPGLDPSPRGPEQEYRHTPHAESVYSQQAPGNMADPTPEPPGLSRDSTEIEYSGPILEKKVTKKVRVKSAPRDDDNTATINSRAKSAPTAETDNVQTKPKPRGTVKISERPKWGQKQKPRKILKQSERDPFYERRAREKEQRRAERQEKLLSMAQRNCPKVSETTTAASRARSRSRDRADDDPVQRARSQSPPAQRPTRRTSHSPHQPTLRPDSPPIPAIKHRQSTTPRPYNPDAYSYDPRPTEAAPREPGNPTLNKYHDLEPINPPASDGHFVPFIRSSAILNPAHAESPLPISREPTIMERARKAYLQEHDPAKYGFTMDNYTDEDMTRNVDKQIPQVTYRHQKDPILNPSLVKDHPSGRQNQILAQLSDLRRGLMQKQRELEIGLPGMEAALAAE